MAPQLHRPGDFAVAEINVADVIRGSALLRDAGALLGGHVASVLKENSDDVRLNFSGVTSATSSAACRFFALIARECGKTAIDRLVFSDAPAWVMNAFEVGYEQVVEGHSRRATA